MHMSNIMVAFVTVIQDVMRIGRPCKEETPYKIIVHANGGRRYASTKVSFLDKDSKKRYRHRYRGSIDRNNVFHPNTTHFDASPANVKSLYSLPWLVLTEAKGRGGRGLLA